MIKLITIYSAESKIGKTTIGLNLGVSLIVETQKTAILVDLSLGDSGVPAWSVLKFPAAKLFCEQECPLERLQPYIQHHSSQLAVLTVDSTCLCDESGAGAFIKHLLVVLGGQFDYILLDLSIHLNRMAYEVIDESDVFLLVVPALDYEQPIGIIGHRQSRVVVNCCDSSLSASDLADRRAETYLLPNDMLTLDNFQRSGIPYVIQTPYRPISRRLGRLARDIGEKQLGIALSGGGALGLSQLGILEVLKRNRIEIDMFTGASFGALIGGAYAAGREFREIKQQIIEWALSCYTSSASWRRHFFLKTFLKETELQKLCDRLLKDTYFEELNIPLHVVAIDVRTGENVIFREGKVLDAIQASMRIPQLFVPFKRTEPHLIDSSVIYPTPVYPLTLMGANVTLAVIVTPSPSESQQYFLRKPHGRITAKERAAKQNYALVTATFDNLMQRLYETPDSPDSIQRVIPDISILPNLEGISWRNFHDVHELIERGMAAAEAVIPELEKLKWG